MRGIEERIKDARRLIEKGEYFRILTHYDVDGVCSSGIIADYLLSKRKKFHISFFRNENKDEMKNIADGEDFVIMLDIGSSIVNELEGNIIVLDHHKPPGDADKIIHINPHLFGYDGAHDACASTLAYMLVNDKKYMKFFLAGVFGDKQYIGGFSGLNYEILKNAGIEGKVDLVLQGNLLDSIVYSTEPFFPGLSGKRDSVESLLKKLGISPNKEVSSLTEDEKIKIGSYLAMNLVKNSKVPSAGRFIVDIDFNIDGSIRYLSELLDSACRTDNQSVALGYTLGGRGYLERMEVLRKKYKSEVINGVYDMLENIFELPYLQYFFVNNKYLGSSISTIASIYLLDPNKAVLSLYVDNMVHISARVNKKMTSKVNIGEIMKNIAGKLGGNGGGHNIAAGATIPKGSEDRFIELVNEEIEKSLSL